MVAFSPPSPPAPPAPPVIVADPLVTSAIAAALTCGIALRIVTDRHLEIIRHGAAVPAFSAEPAAAIEYRAAMIDLLDALRDAALEMTTARKTREVQPMPRDIHEEGRLAVRALNEAQAAYFKAIDAAKEQLRGKRAWLEECRRRLAASQRRVADQETPPDSAMEARAHA